MFLICFNILNLNALFRLNFKTLICSILFFQNEVLMDFYGVLQQSTTLFLKARVLSLLLEQISTVPIFLLTQTGHTLRPHLILRRIRILSDISLVQPIVDVLQLS